MPHPLSVPQSSAYSLSSLLHLQHLRLPKQCAARFVGVPFESQHLLKRSMVRFQPPGY